ncbi:hypothetical protein I2I11_03395 [Pontibacter sp. 172403-2]|uniref:hypothetical protein n=1 Tax=Pontibacter rufus TaxID=2791028 RepID=UPI0018AF9600|nr:hypothetical protein [Pontibacter sp. 172403-2]MBF9252328.1 hypothetical protein [Pontibacter sp. 172403-2]
MFYLCSNSPRYSHSLAIRLLVVLLFVSTFTSACSTDNGQEEQDENPQEKRPELAYADTTATRRSSGEPAVTDLLSDPFVSGRSSSLSAYYDHISTDFTVDANPIENLHQSDVTDTLYTIRFGNSMMEFYAPAQSGELLLQVADIKSNAITLRNNLRVGMSQAELMGSLKRQKDQQLLITQTPAEIVAANREGAPVTLRFFLKNGKVSRIRYEGYVD